MNQYSSFIALLAVVFVMLSSSSCRKQGGVSQVKGSNTVDVYEGYQSVERIDLVTQQGANGVCTGVFVAEDVLLTAAHCIKPRSTEDFKSVKVRNIAPAKIWIHPAYSGHEIQLLPSALQQNGLEAWSKVRVREGDVALLMFSRPMAQGLAYIDAVGGGGRATLVGFGSTSNVDNDDSLQRQVRKGGRMRCGTTTIRIGEKTPNFLFGRGYSGYATSAPGSDSSSAPGDSGGPIFTPQGRLLGIVQSGRSEGDTDYAVYTNIRSPQNWSFINATMLLHKQFPTMPSLEVLKSRVELLNGRSSPGPSQSLLIQDSVVEEMSAKQNNESFCSTAQQADFIDRLIPELGVIAGALTGHEIEVARRRLGYDDPHPTGIDIIGVQQEHDFVKKNNLAVGHVIVGIDSIPFTSVNKIFDYVREARRANSDHEFRVDVIDLN